MGIVLILVCLTVILVALKLYIKLTTGWCRSNVCMVGKTVIVTGANTGIGYETAADIAKRGARVILACRNEDRAKQAVERIIQETNNKNVCYKILNLSSLKSVRQFAEDINATEPRLDVLINNAGLHNVPEEPGPTEDGLQQVMQANYFGHFLLTHLLLDLLKKSAPSRIVNVSSIAAKYESLSNLEDLNNNEKYPHKVYKRSKLCNILFTIELNEYIRESGITTYCLHPGAILTEFTRKVPFGFKEVIEFVLKWFFKDSKEGAQTTIYCAVEKGIEQYSGKHFHDCHVVETYKTAQDTNLAKALWQKTEELVHLKKYN